MLRATLNNPANVVITGGTISNATIVTPTLTGGTITNSTITTPVALTLTGYTVAGLPAGTVGQMAYVTDALTPAFAAAVVGGGAVVITVFRNATGWVAA